jgi:GT2 family glycosyltransferase
MKNNNAGFKAVDQGKSQRVCAVYLTYADRAHLLEKAVRASYAAGVHNIIIVDNKSEQNSQKIISKMENLYGKNMQVVRLNENRGAAGGYKAGLEAAMKKRECDMVWLLDDDCVPEKNSLRELIRFREEIISKIRERKTPDKKTNNIALFSMRFSLPDYLHKSDKELELEKLEEDLLNTNSFCFFSIKRVLSLIFKAGKGKGKKPNYKRRYVETVIAPFGSLLFDRKLISKVGFPKEEFFTYFSDTEYTYRMHEKHRVRFFLVPSSKVKDIDCTFQHGYVRNYFSIGKIMENFHNISDQKMYYEYRNRIILEKQLLVKSKAAYNLNKLVFYSVIYPLVYLIYCSKYSDDKMKTMRKAIRDGKRMKL